MKVIFLGTPELALPSLRAIHRKHDVRLVVTQPDRPRGRGRRSASPPVKICAAELGIPLRQPASLGAGGVLEQMRSTEAEILVVVAYGLLLPENLLEAFPHGAVNLHFSLLPAYRGAAPVNWALIRGEKISGVTTFRLTSTMDGGPVYLRRPVAIARGETAGELGERLAAVGAAALTETLDGIEAGTLLAESQDEALATRAPKLTKEHGRIDWSLTSREIVDLIRGVNPWPGAFTELEGKTLKVWRAEAVEEAGDGAPSPPGTILRASPRRGLAVATLDGVLSLTEVQAGGKRRMTAREYLAGHSLGVGQRFS